MNYREFLDRLVDYNKVAAHEFYNDRLPPLEGALSALEACRDLSPPELAALLERARRVHKSCFKRTKEMNRYWWVIGYLHEVEWVCDVVSFILINQDMDPIVRPTIRAAKTAKYITDQEKEAN